MRESELNIPDEEKVYCDQCISFFRPYAGTITEAKCSRKADEQTRFLTKNKSRLPTSAFPLCMDERSKTGTCKASGLYFEEIPKIVEAENDTCKEQRLTRRERIVEAIKYRSWF